MAYQYPLQLSFKLIALAPRIRIRDAADREIFYVQQKVMALKEHVRVFSSEAMTEQLYEIRADRILDFSARYTFTDMRGREIGAIKHRGMRSIWNAHYDIFAGDAPGYVVSEDNPWIKIGDALFSMIPFVDLFGGYVFNPSYTLYRGTDKESGTPLLHLKKQPAFFESLFIIDRADGQTFDADEETRLLLGLLMLVQLERSRG